MYLERSFVTMPKGSPLKLIGPRWEGAWGGLLTIILDKAEESIKPGHY